MSDAILQQILVGQNALEARFEEAERRNAERHTELMGHMRRVEAKVDRLDIRVDRLHDDMVDLKGRVAFVEDIMGNLATQLGSQPGRLDRFQAQIELTEKRLDLYQPPHAA